MFVGEYSDGRDTLVVCERSGDLHLVSPKGDERLVLAGDSTFATQDHTTGGRIIRGDDGTVRALASDDRIYERLSYGTGTFHIVLQRPLAELRAEAEAARPPVERGTFRTPELTELAPLDTSMRFDIRYATENNFMGARFYSQARAFLQHPAAEALVRAHRWLRQFGYGVIIHDAYRPWYVTKMFWDATPPAQRDFVANPARGSKHNRGCAVDLSLYDLRTGKEVEMPSGYDEFSTRAYADFPGGTSRQRWYRALLRAAMEREGFHVERVEWWHFDYGDWRHYPIGNIRFEDIH